MRFLLDSQCWLWMQAQPDLLGPQTLPSHHRDPFDRLLVAQAQLERATLLSSDLAFADSDVTVRWVEE